MTQLLDFFNTSNLSTTIESIDPVVALQLSTYLRVSPKEQATHSLKMSGKNEQGSMDVKQKNVLEAPLHKLSSESSSTSKSLPSSLHAGMCSPSNPIAATLTAAFLDFADLRKSGVNPGDRFCISASTWKGAVDKGIKEVPRVKLECTHEKALETVDIDVLKKWKADTDNEKKVERPGDAGGLARESQEIGGKEPKA